MKRWILFIGWISLFTTWVWCAIDFQPANPLPGQSVKITLTPAGPLTYRVLSWNLGDGTVSTINSKEFTHIYRNAGAFTVTVQYKSLFGMSAPTLTETKVLQVVERRRIQFSPGSPGPGQAVNLEALNFFSDRLLWIFGDGQETQTGHRCSHVYTQAGNYTIKVREYSGDSPVTIQATIAIRDRRAVSFSPQNPLPGQSVNFQSKQFLSNCVIWNFNDQTGNQRGHKSIQHAFAAPGTYQVTARDQCGDAPAVTTAVQVRETRRLTASPSAPECGEKVMFKAQGFLTPCVVWTFNDQTGNVTGGQSTAHTFSRPGTYQVSARDQCGDGPPITTSIQVQECRSISIEPGPVRSGQAVTFTAKGFTNPCVEWHFNDGGQPERGQASQAHTFTNPGTYRVTARDDCGRPGAPQAELTVNVIPGLATAPAPTFKVTRVRLRFLKGGTRARVSQGDPTLQAVADLTVSSSGAMTYQWLVNGLPLPLRSVSVPVAGNVRLISGLTPPLPTRNLGRHRVSLKLISPAQALTVPEIAYTVFLKAAKKSIKPKPEKTQPIIEIIRREIVLPCPDTNDVDLLTITQLRPDAYFSSTGEQNRSNPHVLTRESLLSWELLGDPHAITFFEVEFHRSKDDKQDSLLAARRVPGSQTYLASDFQLIQELREALSSGKRPLPRARPSPCDPAYMDTMNADVWWTVKGYRVVDCPWGPHAPGSAASSPPADGSLQVHVRKDLLRTDGAAEEMWPREVLVTRNETSQQFEALNLPDNWTGITCPAGGSNPGGVSITNLDRETSATSYSIVTGQINEEVDPNNYPMQRWELTGHIDTGYTPMAVEGDIQWNAPQSGMGADTVGSVVFRNVFVDWGDGRVERLKGTPDCIMTPSSTVFGMENRNLLKGAFTLTPAFHRYLKPGAYTIRIYQLANGWLANAPPTTDGMDPEYTILGALGAATAVQGAFSSTGASSPKPIKTSFSADSSAGAAALATGISDSLDHGVLFFCQDVVITQRQDLCASGPLNLVDIQVTGFPARPASPPAASAQVSRVSSKVIDSPRIKELQPEQPLGKKVSVRTDVSPADSGPQIPTASTCDRLFTATAAVRYFGIGSIEVRWLVDGVEIGRETYNGLSSPQRQNLKDNADQSDCSRAILNTLTAESPALPVSSTGRHKLQVIARAVVPFFSPFQNRMVSRDVLDHGHPEAVIPWVRQTLNGLPAGITPDNSPDLAISDGVTLSDLNQYSRLHQKPPTSAIIHAPPGQVAASSPYMVRLARPGSICGLTFPTTQGDFVITNVEGRLQKTPLGYNGTGILILPMTSGSDSNKEYGIPVSILNWTIDESNGVVQRGTIDLSPAVALSRAPAVAARLAKLQGRVWDGKKDYLMATLQMEFKNRELRLPGDNQGVEKPPSWTKAAPLSSAGDWLATGTLPEILLSWSAFRVSSPQITFDLHKSSHAPMPGSCAVTDPSWVGVDLGQATIKPYTFDMMGPTALTMPVTGWVVNDQGVCGHAESAAYAMNYKKGRLAFDSIVFDAFAGTFSARYKNLVIHVPWLEVDLKGDATLNNLSGQYGLNFSGVTAPAVQKKYPQFTLTATDLSFTSEQNIGWVIRSRTHFDLKSENKRIMQFTIPRFFYGFDGYPYFSQGGKHFSRDLGSSSKLGDTNLMLKQVILNAKSGGPKALGIKIPCEAYLSENPIIPAADTQLDYAVMVGDPVYTGTGPRVMPFTLDVAFPIGAPVISARMVPEYSPGTGSPPPPGSGPSAGDADPLVPVSAGHSGTRYYGNVDMAMFGGPPVAAQLLLGYQGGQSYFLIRGDIPLGPSGIPMSPLPFTLFRLSGGLGYNFPADSFYQMSIESAQPDMQGETLFMAGMRIGSSDRFTFTLDGITTVTSDGQAGMKFDAWLLTRDHVGNGQLQGFLQYGGGAFSGKIWGGLNLMNDMVGISLGDSQATAAMDLHLGQGDWHFYAGQRNGPRIQATILGKSTAEGYLMLGNQVGLAAGGRQVWNLTGTDAAYVRGNMDVGLQISPQPKITGDFYSSLSAGICVPDVGCISGGVSAHVRVSALPLSMQATASLDLPWPLGSISFTVSL